MYRTAPEEVGFYEFQRWAADPRQLVTGVVIDHLRAIGQFVPVRQLPPKSYIKVGHRWIYSKLTDVQRF